MPPRERKILPPRERESRDISANGRARYYVLARAEGMECHVQYSDTVSAWESILDKVCFRLASVEEASRRQATKTITTFHTLETPGQ